MFWTGHIKTTGVCLTQAPRSAAGLLSAGQELLSSAGETTALLNSCNSGSGCRKVCFGWRGPTVCAFGVGCQFMIKFRHCYTGGNNEGIVTTNIFTFLCCCSARLIIFAKAVGYGNLFMCKLWGRWEFLVKSCVCLSFP